MHLEERKEAEKDFSLKSFFSPLTNAKAIHWIIIIGVIVYANMLFNGFVWDDNIYIINYPLVHSLNFINLIGKNLYNSGAQYRPILAIYFATLYSFYSTNSFFYHLFQLTIHIINSILVFILFAKFFNKNLSLLLSLIFLIHPIQVESVSYISATGDTSFLTFGILALNISMTRKINIKNWLLIFLLLVLALLTKETALLFIFVMWFYAFTFKRTNFLILSLLGILSTIIYLIIRFTIGGIFFSIIPVMPITRLSLIQRIINIPAIFFYYIKTFFFPYQLASDQQWIITSINFSNFYLPLIFDSLFLLVIIFLGVYLYSHKKKLFKYYMFFFFWFLIGVGLHLQIFPLDATVSDRWFYFPIIGLLGLIGIAIQVISNHSKNVQLWLYSLITMLLILLAIRTMIRNTNWSDPVSLYTHDLQVSDTFDIENNLGEQFILEGRYKDALPHLKKSTMLFPQDTNLAGLAFVYEKLGNYNLAIKYYNQALRTDEIKSQPHPDSIYLYLSELLIIQKSFSNAKNILEKGVSYYPTDSTMWLYLAYTEYKLHDYEDALNTAKRSYAASPSATTAFVLNRIQSKLPLNINLTF